MTSRSHRTADERPLTRSVARRFLATMLPILALLGAASFGPRAESPQPNIVFLLVDDLRWDMLGHVGAPVESPSIDRLAAEGMRFENAFTVTSLCSPSRATILTGVYPHVHGVLGNTLDFDAAVTPTVAQLLQARGYTTGMIGKWHIGTGSEPRPGWSRWFSLWGHGEYRDPLINVDGRLVRRVGYNTDILTDEAVEFIESNRDRPFFLHLGYKAVHSPFTPADRHVGQSADADWDLRPNVENAPLDQMQRYAETLAAVDESVARIDAALASAGVRDRTIVVFTSDNGFLFGEHGRTDKRLFFEESVRVPLIVRYPGTIAPGSVRTEHALNLDLAPTLLELAGTPVPAHMQGKSLVDLLRGRRVSWRGDWLYAYNRELQWPQSSSMVALRTDRYKYVEFPEGKDMFCYFSGEPLLFDLALDPYELRNLALDPAYDDLRHRLARRLANVRAVTGYQLFPVDLAAVADRLRWLVATNAVIAAEFAEHFPDGFEDWDSGVCPTGSRW